MSKVRGYKMHEDARNSDYIYSTVGHCHALYAHTRKTIRTEYNTTRSRPQEYICLR